MTTGWKGQYFKYRDYAAKMGVLYKERKDFRDFLELILSLSTIIIFVLFAIKPTAITIITLYNQIRDKRETLNSLNQKIKDLQKASNIFNQNQSLIPDVDSSVFGIPEPDTISKQILGLAAKDSVNLLGLSIGQLTIIGKETSSKTASDVRSLPNGALSMPLSISVKGSYTNLLAFVKDLENLKIPVRFDSISINSSQTQDGSVIVSIISARVPYLGQQ
jgi:hypothetical protein